MKDIQTNLAYLERRNEDLLQIKKVSEQIKGITEFMGQEVKLQGQEIDKIEEYVKEIHSFVVAAESEIREASVGGKKNYKKLILISIALIMVIGFIVGMIILIIINI
jgi:t-SNARE complex subunit (syntaxin)